MIIDDYRVELLTVDRFDDFVAVVGRSGIGGCWCMYWTCPTSAAWGEGCRGGSEAPNRRAFQDLVEAGPPPGLLAYDDGDPRQQGGRVVESYPWDTSEVKADSVVYTGLASTFARLGFEVVQRRAGHKPMMRIAIAAEVE